MVNEQIINKKVKTQFTIKALNSSSVIIRQLVSVGADILIMGEHECSSVPGVIQAKSMTKLMGSHQQQIHTLKSLFYVRHIMII